MRARVCQISALNDLFADAIVNDECVFQVNQIRLGMECHKRSLSAFKYQMFTRVIADVCREQIRSKCLAVKFQTNPVDRFVFLARVTRAETLF